MFCPGSLAVSWIQAPEETMASSQRRHIVSALVIPLLMVALRYSLSFRKSFLFNVP